MGVDGARIQHRVRFIGWEAGSLMLKTPTGELADKPDFSQTRLGMHEDPQCRRLRERDKRVHGKRISRV